MDVRLPDGTLVRNVPEGTTKAQLIEKLQASGRDVSGLVDLGVKQELSKPVTVGGVSAEAAKGLARGATGVALSTVPQMVAGPLAAPFVQEPLQQLTAPLREAIAARPENTTEQMVGTGSEIAGSAVISPPAGLRQAAVNVLAPAVGGAVGEQVAGEPGKIIGALAVPTAQLAKVGVDVARAKVAPQVQHNVEQFKEAGDGTPSVGQATELNFVQGLENLLSKFPGGQAIFRRFAEKQQAGMGAGRPGTSAEDAGRAIERGVTGEGGFISRTKETWLKLDQKLADKVGGTNLAPTNTVKALDELVAPVPGAERTTGALANPKLVQMRENITSDLEAGGGQLSFEAMRQLRSRIGGMLDDALITGIPGGELKKLYGAISKDLETAAKAAGAEGEFSRQAQYYAARIDRIENTLERVLGKTPEDTFKRFMPTDQNQVTTVRQVMRSLDPEQRKVVTAAVVDRLGRAKSSVQNETGEVFSSETFLTNWNKMSDGAKAQIFRDPSIRKNMDAIASSAANIREGSQTFANPSGTAGRSAGYVMAGAVGTSIATGNPIPALAAAGAVGGANVTSRMLTNPKVVEWLAQGTRVPPEQTAGHLARLGAIYQQTTDQGLKEDLANFVKQSGEGFEPPQRGSPVNRTGGGSR